MRLQNVRGFFLYEMEEAIDKMGGIGITPSPPKKWFIPSENLGAEKYKCTMFQKQGVFDSPITFWRTILPPNPLTLELCTSPWLGTKRWRF